MKQTDFSWKTLKGASIHAVEWRPEASAKAVVALVHGVGEHSQRYEHMAEAFSKEGVAMVAFDLPGHGRSEGKRGHSSYVLVMVEIDRLIEEARARFPGAKVFLYGHSLGGAICLNYLIERRPSLAGALIGSPGLSPATPVPGLKMLLARIMAKIAPSFTLANDLDAEGLSRDAAIVKKYRDDPLMHDMISARLGLDLIESGQRIIMRAAEISLPLLLLQGSADRFVDPGATERFAAASGKNVTFQRFEGAYHELHNEPDKQVLFRMELDWMALLN
ncbi:MAG: lysophospholipase [Spirochaetota bacterium]